MTANKVVASIPRPIAPDFLGFNGNMTSLDQPWSDTGLRAAFVKTHAGHLRYPGGTISTYWNWETGWLDTNLDEERLIPWMRQELELRHPTKSYTLENFKLAYDASGATPLFTLNMVTKDLDNQLAMLHHAADLGLPVERVELGNEYFFGIGAEPYVHEVFPNIASYGRSANEWAKAIRADFPGIKIAAIGAEISQPGWDYALRRFHWNEELAPMLSRDVDALTIHVYFHPNIGPTVSRGMPVTADIQIAQMAALKDEAELQKLFALPADIWTRINEFSHLPEMELWLTEFNFWDSSGALRGTWAHGLMVAQILNVFLSDSRINLATLHNLIGGGLFAAIMTPGIDYFEKLQIAEVVGVPYELAASGQMMALFGEVMTGMETAVSLTVPGSPTVWGWQFSKGDGETKFIFLNVGSDEKLVTVTNEMAERPFTQYHTDPHTYITSQKAIIQTSGQCEAALVLPPYSVTTITS